MYDVSRVDRFFREIPHKFDPHTRIFDAQINQDIKCHLKEGMYLVRSRQVIGVSLVLTSTDSSFIAVLSMELRMLIRFALTLACLAAIFPLGTAIGAEASPQPKVEVQKIWDKGVHNAFTDLIRHNGAWYCVFREGAGHVSPDGALRVLTSKDGQTWESAALVTMDGADLRDAKISVAPNGQLVLCGAAARVIDGKKSHQTYTWFSKDGTNWSEANQIGDKDYWIWRLVWNNGTAYGIGYQTREDRKNTQIRLYKSQDGKKFETVVSNLGPTGYPNETSLEFLKDGTAYCVLRRDGAGEDSNALLGTSSAPYTEWKWDDLGIRVGGPQSIQLADGRIAVSGRSYPGGAKTKVWILDPKAKKLTEVATLPSGGDTSYPGLVEYDGKLWVSYYSSHEGKTNIYLAKVSLP